MNRIAQRLRLGGLALRGALIAARALGEVSATVLSTVLIVAAVSPLWPAFAKLVDEGRRPPEVAR